MSAMGSKESKAGLVWKKEKKQEMSLNTGGPRHKETTQANLSLFSSVNNLIYD